METSLFVTVLLLMYDAYLIRRHWVLTAVMAALSIWLRPDAVLAVAPIFAFTAWRSWQQALRMGLITGAILLPWLLFATLYFGSPIPQSILAKQALYTSNYLTFTYYFLFAFLATGTLGLYRSMPALLPTFIAAIFLIVTGLRVYLRRLDPALVIVLYPLLYYLVMFQQKAPMFFIWYYIPLLPGFLLLFWTALQQLSTRLPANLRRLAFVLTAILLVGIPSVYTQLYPEWTTARDGEVAFQKASLLAQPQVQPGQVVYAPDIGVIGWELSQAYILDSVGLVSPQVIDYYAAIGSYDRMNPAVIAHFRPDFIIAITPLFGPLLSEPSFTSHYQLAGVGTQGASSVSVYSRRP
jgi:arabinofuranosyltransferase